MNEYQRAKPVLRKLEGRVRSAAHFITLELVFHPERYNKQETRELRHLCDDLIVAAYMLKVTYQDGSLADKLTSDYENAEKEANKIVPKEWTGNLVGLMHTHRITNKMLADHMDITEQYASMILNGKREPPGAEKRFAQAVEELIQEQGNDSV